MALESKLVCRNERVTSRKSRRRAGVLVPSQQYEHRMMEATDYRRKQTQRRTRGS